MENSKVTIIAALYNSEKFAKKMVKSLIHQTYQNLEIILVDDGSTDQSGEICNQHAKIDDRIKVIHEENQGVCAARNAAMKIMSGEYVCFVDGDDWLSLDYIEYMMGLIEKTNSDMALSDSLFTTRDQKQNEVDYIEIWSPEETTERLIYPGMVYGPWNKIYSVKVIEKYHISFVQHWFGEGIRFATDVAQHSNQCTVGHRKVYHYRLNNAESGVTTFNVQNGRYALNNIKELQDNLKIKSLATMGACNWHIWSNYYFLLIQIIGSHTIEENREEYRSCIQYIRKNAFEIFLYSNVNAQEKFKIICKGLAPVLNAKMNIRKKIRLLQNDIHNSIL